MALNSDYLLELRTAVKNQIDTDFAYFAVGDDDTAETASDTALGNETYRDARTAVDKATFPAEISVTGEIGAGSNNGNDINEFGWSKVVTAAADTEQRIALTTGFTKTSDIIVIVESVFEITVTESES